MGQNPRSLQQRRHTHSAPKGRGRTLDENGLFELIERIKGPAFLLVLDGVQDPHNLGACMRTAEAAGVHALIAPRDRAVSLTETVSRIAVGAAEKLPFVQVTNLARTLDQLKERGIWIVGAASEATESLYTTDLSGPLAVVIGFEGSGLRRLTREKCDFLVQIPMLGTMESLNVSVATGVCLFEAVRQRLGQSPSSK
ncbi:MAG: 23S rRNA (guanosine(2251)-2'-O)-methyltransferase RlmB [bacterium]|nr:23S rRNA (guanosine(2251)-2'-O)-methyltransferase RlmB [bacterium]